MRHATHRVVIGVVILSLLPIPVSAQTPLRDALAAAAQQAGQSSSARVGMFWAGIALMGTGATLSILANTALRREDCVVSATAFYCVEESNKGVWATGVAMAAAGGILTTIGASRSITIGPWRLAYRVRW